jgi:hypothetical protein
MSNHDFWPSPMGELTILVLTFVSAVALTIMISNVTVMVDSGPLFPLLLLGIFMLLSKLLRHRWY